MPRLFARAARVWLLVAGGLADAILLGRPASPAGGAGGGDGGDPLLQVAVVAAVVLGAALTFAYAFGLLSGPAPQERNRPRRGPARESGADDPLLPRAPSGFFPPSHHEKIHDAKYLKRMLEAEERRRRSTRRRQRPADTSPGAADTAPGAADNPRGPADPSS